MKKLIPLSLAVAVLLTTLITVSPTNVNAQGAGLVSSILNKMERNRRDLKSLRASISMEKYNAQLRETETKYQGVMAYVPATGRNAYVRVEWQRPKREILTVADGRYTLYNPRLNIAYEGVAGNRGKSKPGSMLNFLNMPASQIKASFDTQYVGEETLWGGVNTWHLKVVPRAAASFKYAEIWVDGSGNLIQTKVIEKNDDSTTVRLMDLQRNPNISPDEFRQQLGGDVKRVKS